MIFYAAFLVFAILKTHVGRVRHHPLIGALIRINNLTWFSRKTQDHDEHNCLFLIKREHPLTITCLDADFPSSIRSLASKIQRT